MQKDNNIFMDIEERMEHCMVPKIPTQWKNKILLSGPLKSLIIVTKSWISFSLEIPASPKEAKSA